MWTKEQRKRISTTINGSQSVSTNPPTENYHEIWTVYMYVCMCI